MNTDLSTSLQQQFGFSDFRPGQRQALDALLSGQHCLVVMPTGSGKSLIYQLASLHLPGLTLVISPLIALMKDQVDSLERRRIPSTFINSAIPANEHNRRLKILAQGGYRVLYIAPERLRSASFLEALHSQTVSLLAVDEAHCISEWGHDFRPDYLRIAEARKSLNNPLTVALTATATPQVQDDIVRLLGLPAKIGEGGTCRIVTGFNRPNLKLEVRYTHNPRSKLRALRELLIELSGGSAIIYTGTRREAEEIADFAHEVAHTPARYYHAGLEASERERIQNEFMHGGLHVVAATNAFGMGIDRPDVRLVIHHNLPGSLEAYYQEAGRAGRDSQPARAVLLYAPEDRALQEWFIDTSRTSPEELRTLYDTINIPEGKQTWLTLEGLSIRTGMPEVRLKVALAELERAAAIDHLVDEGMRMLVQRGAWDPHGITAAIEHGKQHLTHRKKQLDKMVAYAESNDCRRRIILKHFGDRDLAVIPNCCDNCVTKHQTLRGESSIHKAEPASQIQTPRVAPPTEIPVNSPAVFDPETNLTQQAGLIILDAVRRLPLPVGRTKLGQILKGSQARAIQRFGYDQSIYYGRFEIFSQEGIEGMIEQLIELGDLKVVGGEYPVLKLTPQGFEAIQNKAHIPLKLPRQLSPKFTNKKAIQRAGGTIAYTEQLFVEGLSPSEISRRRGLAPSSIYHHLAELIAAGRLDVGLVVSEETRVKIEAAIRQVGSVDNLTPLKLILPEEIEYGMIRCVVENWKRTHSSVSATPISSSSEKMKSSISPIQAEEFTRLTIEEIVRLGNSNSLEALPEIIAALESPDGNARRLAASALGKLKSQQSVEPLMRLLQKESKPQVRQYAVKALGNIGDPCAQDLLRTITGDNSERDYTRTAAKIALQKIKRESTEKKTSAGTSNQPKDPIGEFFNRSHPRPLPGPWNAGWALGFHSSFSGAEWNRSGVGDLAYRLKYQGDLTALPPLVELTAALIKEHPELGQVDAIVPVLPSTPRTMDPVSAYAQALAEHFHLKVLPAVVKTRQTEPQKQFHTLAQKRTNVKGAFAVQEPVGNLRLLVVDDLFDSGATLEEITRVLENAGAVIVNVLTMTRTIHSDK